MGFSTISDRRAFQKEQQDKIDNPELKSEVIASYDKEAEQKKSASLMSVAFRILIIMMIIAGICAIISGSPLSGVFFIVIGVILFDMFFLS